MGLVADFCFGPNDVSLVASHGDGGDGDGGGDDDDDDDDDDGGGSGGRNVPGSCSTWYQVDNPFEKGCECTRVTYTHATKAFATSCVKNGKVENVTATLIPSPSGPPGVFDEISFGPITSNAHLAIPLI